MKIVSKQRQVITSNHIYPTIFGVERSCLRHNHAVCRKGLLFGRLYSAGTCSCQRCWGGLEADLIRRLRCRVLLFHGFEIIG